MTGYIPMINGNTPDQEIVREEFYELFNAFLNEQCADFVKDMRAEPRSWPAPRSMDTGPGKPLR